MNYYAWANRYRGNGHKLAGMALLAAPLLLADIACVVALWLSTSFPLWAGLPVAGITILHVLVIFKWFWGSDYWPTGSKPSERKLSDLWTEKSVAAFFLIGAPWFGFRMGEAGGIYHLYIDPQDLQPNNVQMAEYRIGAFYGRQQLLAIGQHITMAAAYTAWRLV